MIIASVIILIFAYLSIGVYFYAQKRSAYSHLKYSISELGETGSEYEKQVSYFVFMPVGLTFLVLAFISYSSQYNLAYLCAVYGASYFLSALFPCDSEAPLLGTWKNSIHYIVGGICYGAMLHHLMDLADENTTLIIKLPLITLTIFLVSFVIGWPKALIGLFQRIAESSVVLFMVWLALQ